jgi:hypothetical protein
MKLSLPVEIGVCVLLVLICLVLYFIGRGTSVFAATPKIPAHLPPGLYDEAQVLKYTLPDPLVMADGVKVTDITTWKEKRRPEILNLFATNVYGRTMIGRPKEMTWKVAWEDRSAMDGNAIAKNVTIYFAGKVDGPKTDVNIVLPAHAAKKPVPVFLMPGWVRKQQVNLILERGYGLVGYDPNQVEPDIRSGSYERSVRKFFARPDQNQPGPDEWGAIGAWAWAMSRTMDYIVTDPDIDANRICVTGFSRFGKVAMWAGAQDERFAIVFSGESGCGGAVIVRRGFGETVRAINNTFPHWFSRNFKSYGERVNELPVDWHMLIALMAPRPVYIATAEEDLWGDPRGSFLAAKNAELVYQLFGEKGLGVNNMPPVETPVGDYIGYHNRKGAHGLNDYDWQQFLNFADRHLGTAKIKE